MSTENQVVAIKAAALVEIRKTAFAKWLLQMPRGFAVDYVIGCLAGGGPENMAWELWRAVHGKTTFQPHELRRAVGQMINALKSVPSDEPPTPPEAA